MLQWLKNAWNGLLDWLQSLWDAFVSFLNDLGILILDAFLSSIAGLINLLPVPDFLGTGLQSFISGIDPSVLYFLSRSGFDAAIALIGTAVLFRLTRKLLTLGQW